MRKQNTLKANIEFSGIGLHSGQNSHVLIKPAPEDTGIVFVHRSAQTTQFIPYRADSITDTKNNISISNGKAVVKTVEHLVAGLSACRVDNCLIEISSSEVPIMDGSSREFVEKIRLIGTVPQSKYREEFRVINPVWVTDGDKYLVALPYDGFKLSYTISFPNSPIGTQTYQTDMDGEVFAREISGARTFGFIEDLDAYQKSGLVLGGSYDNVHAFSRKENRSLNAARYNDEPVRHKMLDLVGGLALLPYDLRAFVISYKSGHSLDVRFVRKVMDVLSGKGVASVRPEDYRALDTNYYYHVADLLDLEKTPS